MDAPRLTFMDWDTAAQQLNGVWSDLVASGGFNPSLHPDWLGITLSVWNLRTSSSVALIEEGERCLAIIPFMVRRRTVAGVPLRCLELCSNVLAYHPEIVAAGDVERALRALLADRRLPKWDVLRLANLPETGPTACAARALAAEGSGGLSRREAERSPYLTITSDWQSYLKTRPKKLRSNITRCERMMRDAGESGMTWYESGSDVTALLQEMLVVEAASWKAGAGIDIRGDAPEAAYYTRLLPWLAQHGLMANMLYVHGKPAAYALCANWRGWVGQLKTSFTEQLRDAGSRVINASLERAFVAGAREYDFLGDAAFHKLRWTESIRPHEDLWVFAPSLRGRTLAALKRVTDRIHASRERPSHDKVTES
ncbi:MAG TPA: GNAT family N-acetyltransferase [Steroidobacteraceae bacterium]|nr:GNAT family N-acetyltransferase [Steroidobacteraceae bacterium]